MRLEHRPVERRPTQEAAGTSRLSEHLTRMLSRAVGPPLPLCAALLRIGTLTHTQPAVF